MENKQNMPLVSIITAGWNGKNFVFKLFDSIIEQTYENIEYIYVDDGATDGTDKIVLSYKERFKKRGIDFKYVRKENGGVSSALNCGLKYVNGKYLCWAEYDDIYEKESIEKRVEFLENHPEYVCVTNDALVCSGEDNNKVLGKLSEGVTDNENENQFELLLRESSITVAICHMVRAKEFFQIYKNREIYDSRLGPNFQMLLPLYYQYKRAFLEETLCRYIVREESVSHQKGKYNDELEKVKEVRKIKESVLKIIDMPEEDYEKYLQFIEDIYNQSCLKVASRFFEKKDTKRYYRIIREKGNNSWNLKLLYLRGNYRIFFLLYEKVIKKLKKIRYA